jgi:hypothetical protein
VTPETLEVAAAGSAANVTSAEKAGSPDGQPPSEELDPPESDFVELCNLTSVAPFIKRSRCNVWATSDWLTAQPVSVNTGTLPTGVLDAGVAPAAAVEEVLEVVETVGPELAPMLACRVLIEAPVGNTRPSSCSECDQSKRDCTNCVTVCTRLWAIETNEA